MARPILFRITFIFFLLYVLLGSNEIVPLSNPFYDVYIKPFYKLIPWIGQHILHLSYPITSFPDGGSSDTTFDYVILLFITVLALWGALAWTLIDRQRNDYWSQQYWLMLIIRYYCAWTMFSFGLSKVFGMQFSFPSPGSLQQPLGSYSPMHLVWTFFGYSSTYSALAGWSEVISGLLLLFRRTTRLGALLFLAVMVNVLFVNLFYDVCLKTTSIILVIMACYLLSHDWRKLLDFFIRNKPTMPDGEWKPRFARKWINPLVVFFQYGLTLVIVVNITVKLIGLRKDFSDARVKPALYGIFNVQRFVRGKDTLPPLLTDTTRWNKLTLNDHGSYGAVASVRLMNDSARSYVLKADTVSRRMALYRASDTATKFYFDYAFIGKDSLYMHGVWKGDSVSMILKKYDLHKFLLVNRGFHWINEVPYQR